MHEEWTILKVIQWTSEKFKAVGIPTHRLDSELLVAHALGTERIKLYINFNQPLGKDELGSIRKLIQSRLKRVPVSYITGRKEFMSLGFHVEPGVFIPRPDTETLVEYIIEHAGTLFSGKSAIDAADVCTGTGCIGISLMFHLGMISKMDFYEKSPAALACTRANCDRHLAGKDYSIIEADVLLEDSIRGNYDLITCNPPYIPDQEIDLLEPEVSRHHSRLSLSGGADGLEYYRMLVPVLEKCLNPGGLLCMEIGSGQQTQVAEIYQAAGLSGIIRVSDLANIERHVIGRKNS